MKVVYMGTPDIAVPTLEKVIAAGHEVIAVVTQPDKAKGRGKNIQFPPVKEAALKHDIPVYQPVKARDPEFVEILKELAPDVIVVVAFGQLLPKEILDIPPYGCINVHTSLLPKYRGAAPIQWAVIRGEKQSGVTTMYMDVGLDTGDMILKTVIDLEPDETAGTLHDKLGEAGAELLVKTLEQVEHKTAVRIPQDHSQAGEYARMLTKQMGNIDFQMPAAEIECLIRGLNPWPSAYTSFNGKTLKIWKAAVAAENYEGEPGTVVRVDKKGFLVQTGNGCLNIIELQLEGKKRVDAESFLRGYPLSAGMKLG